MSEGLQSFGTFIVGLVIGAIIGSAIMGFSNMQELNKLMAPFREGKAKCEESLPRNQSCVMRWYFEQKE